MPPRAACGVEHDEDAAPTLPWHPAGMAKRGSLQGGGGCNASPRPPDRAGTVAVHGATVAPASSLRETTARASRHDHFPEDLSGCVAASKCGANWRSSDNAVVDLWTRLMMMAPSSMLSMLRA